MLPSLVCLMELERADKAIGRDLSVPGVPPSCPPSPTRTNPCRSVMGYGDVCLQLEKMRKESIEMFKAGGREDMVAGEQVGAQKVRWGSGTVISDQRGMNWKPGQ